MTNIVSELKNRINHWTNTLQGLKNDARYWDLCRQYGDHSPQVYLHLKACAATAERIGQS